VRPAGPDAFFEPRIGRGRAKLQLLVVCDVDVTVRSKAGGRRNTGAGRENHVHGAVAVYVSQVSKIGMAQPRRMVNVPTSAKDTDCMPEGKEPS
jgi:hypothetical protein